MADDVLPGVDGVQTDAESIPWILRRAAERRGEVLTAGRRPVSDARTVSSTPWSTGAVLEDAVGHDAADPTVIGPHRLSPAPPTPAAPVSFTPVSTVDQRREARDLRLRAWAWLALGLVLVTAFGVSATVVEGRAEELERNGARVPGVVAELRERGEDAIFEPETVVVELTWQDRLRRELIHLDDIGPQYRGGQPVTVLVDRDDPDRVSVPGESNQSPYTLAPMLAAFVGGVAALIAAGLHAHAALRVRRDLEREHRASRRAGQALLFSPSRARPAVARRAWPWLAAALGILVAGFGGQLIIEGQAEDLERNGARVTGVVAEVVRADDAGVLAGDQIVVELTWQDRPRREVIHLDEMLAQYTDGAPVTVLVDRSDPRHVSVPGQTNQSPWTLWPFAVALFIGVGLTGMGIWEWTRTRRVRRRLSRATGPRPVYS